MLIPLYMGYGHRTILHIYKLIDFIAFTIQSRFILCTGLRSKPNTQIGSILLRAMQVKTLMISPAY